MFTRKMSKGPSYDEAESFENVRLLTSRLIGMHNKYLVVYPKTVFLVTCLLGKIESISMD